MDEDALDAFRIFHAIDTADLVRGLAEHHDDEHAATVTNEAIEIYRDHGSTRRGRIAQLAAGAAQGDPAVAPAFAALVNELLAQL